VRDFSTVINKPGAGGVLGLVYMNQRCAIQTRVRRAKKRFGWARAGEI